jgi:hypothetical protein
MVTHDGERYEAAGTQAIVDEIRGAGARNVILLPGLSYANDLSQFLANVPRDPASALAASFHTYPLTRCRTPECWSEELEPIARVMPVIAGEIGQYDCAGAFIDGFMTWADARGVSYLGWAFNTGSCGRRPSLLQAWDGTPTPFGAVLQRHLARQK